jgi:hypothetical protein
MNLGAANTILFLWCMVMKKRRYRLTATKGITGKVYFKKTYNHQQPLPAVGKIYTKEEIQRLEKTMDLRLPKKH